MRPTSSAQLRKALPKPAAAASGPLSAQIAERIGAAIVDGRLALGEALSELKLAAALGVSRTPVREALNLLQLQGLIEIRPQAGSFVFLPSAEDVAELAEFRRVLEVTALRFCFARRRGEALRAMRTAADAMDRARAADDRLAFAHADAAFHQAIAQNSANEHLVAAYRLVSGRISALRTHNLMAAATIRTHSLNEHRAIIGAFARGDLDRAEALLAEHVWRLRIRYRPPAPDRAGAPAAPGRGATSASAGHSDSLDMRATSSATRHSTSRRSPAGAASRRQ